MKIYETGQLLEIAEPGEVLINWSTDADPICNFIEDTFIEDVAANNFSKPKMFKAYQEWFRESGAELSRMLTSERAFTLALQPYFSVEDFRLPKGSDGKREHVRVYRATKRLAMGSTIALTPESEQVRFDSEPAPEALKGYATL